MRLRARRSGEPFPDDATPLALIRPEAGCPRITAVTPAALAKGIRIGMNQADARAILPGLQLRDADPEADGRALRALGEWMSRYSPKVAVDGPSDIMLDITGCAHLFNGETGLLADIGTRLDTRGLTHGLAIADRQAEAWARARFGRDAPLERLPVQALRIDQDLIAALIRLGLRDVGDLLPMPRRSLLNRFGAMLVTRLEALMGESSETFTPLRERPRIAARLGWAEPIGRTGDIEAAAASLVRSVARELEHAVLGARRLDLLLFRVDGETVTLTARSGRPSRDAGHLTRLLVMRLDGLDIGFGIELMRLEVVETAALAPAQSDLAASHDQTALNHLVDRLRSHLGRDRVVRLDPYQSHIPEHAQMAADPFATPPETDWLAAVTRPLRLHPQPCPVNAVAEVPDGPPLRITGARVTGGRVVEAHGPERIEGEWWRLDEPPMRVRDYWCLTTETGERWWIFREGRYGDDPPPVWKLHGCFQ